MQPELYCRPRNLVNYDTFIERLASRDIVIVGERHGSKACLILEKRLFSNLSKIRQLRFAGEDLDTSEMQELMRYVGFENPIELPGHHCEAMTEVILPNVSEDYLLAVVVGDDHLGFLPDMLNLRRPELSNSAVYHRKFDCPNGIYQIKSPRGTDHVVVE